MIITEDVIRNFGFPDIDILRDANLNFRFEGGKDKNEDGVKFHVVNGDTEIFTMDFYIRRANDFMAEVRNISELKKRHIHLNYVTTSPEYRKNGITTFYIKKVIKLAKYNGIDLISLIVAPSGKKDNALNEEELKAFYEKFSTNEVKFIVL